MFELVLPNHLVENKKYKIVSYTEFIGIYKHTSYFEENDFVTVYELFQCFTKDGATRYIHFSPSCSFYEMVPRAQEQMERRALNIIVQGILGDVHFKW